LEKTLSTNFLGGFGDGLSNGPSDSPSDGSSDDFRVDSGDVLMLAFVTVFDGSVVMALVMVLCEGCSNDLNHDSDHDLIDHPP
jgi:hypothetical protein